MICRVAHADEVAMMLGWAADEGWNPGLDDASAFQAADPDGFFVAEQDGQPVAAISLVNHSPDFAFLGLYLCRPAFRGQGIGFALWNHALTHAGSRCIGLDGVAAQEANYARSGFQRVGATVRMEGETEPQLFKHCRPVVQEDLAALIAVDHKAGGVVRRRFLTNWLPPTDHRKSVVLTDGVAPTGFATARTCRSGVKIGPVIAPDTATALRLIKAALAELNSAGPVVIDLPESNRPLLTALTALGFASSFTTARMYRGAPPVVTPMVQAIATMELG